MPWNTEFAKSFCGENDQTAYAQPSIRLGVGPNRMVSISDKLSTSSIDVTSREKMGAVFMAGLELPVSSVAACGASAP